MDGVTDTAKHLYKVFPQAARKNENACFGTEKWFPLNSANFTLSIVFEYFYCVD
jgi:hypothetical protein